MKAMICFEHKCCAGVDVINYTGVDFTKVMPIITLVNFVLTGVGPRGYCWWYLKEEALSILVPRDVTNMMLHGKYPEGMIVTFPDRKDTSGTKMIYKFISLYDVNTIGKPKTGI